MLTKQTIYKYRDYNLDMPEELKNFANNINYSVRGKHKEMYKKKYKNNRNILKNKDKTDKMNLLLNKLNDNNYNEMKEDFVNEQYNNEEFDILINKIIKRIEIENDYTNTYAKIIYELINKNKQITSEGNSKNKQKVDENKKIKIKSILKQTQRKFESTIEIDEEKYEDMEQRNEYLQDKREKIKSITNFIGSLYNENVIRLKIINLCIESMKNKIEENKKYDHNVHGLINLIKVTRIKLKKANRYNNIIKKLEEIKGKTSFKNKCKINNLLDEIKND